MQNWRMHLLALSEPKFRESIIEYVDNKIEETNEKVKISEDNCKNRFDLVMKTMEDNNLNYLAAIRENTIITRSIVSNHDDTLRAIQELSKKQDDHIKSLSVTVELESSAKKSFNFVSIIGEKLGKFYEWAKSSFLGISVLVFVVGLLTHRFTMHDAMAFFVKLWGE